MMDGGGGPPPMLILRHTIIKTDPNSLQNGLQYHEIRATMVQMGQTSFGARMVDVILTIHGRPLASSPRELLSDHPCDADRHARADQHFLKK